ncbi:hypothetical protein [Phyllobacterium bourgognense]|uniref:Uncharacterized protein n=1 Tax=Phyllobacterium bourgognense TaxID=314236 RepID=A0A368YP63_9HYPH|nr:hypothetical protein [Phyllobacterium bourgognense]RCW82022.1 hypothetical protein C7476_109204 [Phyllobacterium bourgognense]
MNNYIAKIGVAAVILAMGTTASMAQNQWTKIGNGPTYEMADAQCNLMAMGAQQGQFAMGSASFVAGAAIGNAIGNAIRVAYVKKQCMTMQGWKWMPVEATKVAVVNGKKVAVRNPNGKKTAEICVRNPASCQ